MSFHCSFERPSDPSAAEVPAELPEDLDDPGVLLIEACELLEETDARFRLGGFGVSEWNLDVGYDLAMFLEDLPALLDALRDGETGRINLASQGIEQTLDFTPGGDTVRIRCLSGTSWVPDPAEESVPKAELEAMLRRLARDFAWSATAVAPRFGRFEPIKSWSEGGN